MSYFDSPIGRCEAVREMVLLDETQHECAREHGCAPGFACPLKGCFARHSGVSDPESLPRNALPRLSPHEAAALSDEFDSPAPHSEAFVFS
jgi:hypothetical protein